MTLLEILVKELPGKGGWPVGANYIAQDSDCSIYGFEERPELEDGHEWMDGTDGGFLLKVGTLAESSDKSTSIITRKQYEAALAESNNVAWNGDGLPPVGCDCQYSLSGGSTWWNCKIEYIVGTQGVVMSCDVFEGVQYVSYSGYPSLVFRPIRSEEERKRDEAIKKLARVMAEPDTHNAKIVYHAIAAGDIPHIKIV